MNRVEMANRLHDAIDGDFLVDAAGPDMNLPIWECGAADVVRWAVTALADDECGEQYGQNPDLCYHEPGHPGSHSNRWGTIWPAPAAPESQPGEAS